MLRELARLTRIGTTARAASAYRFDHHEAAGLGGLGRSEKRGSVRMPGLGIIGGFDGSDARTQVVCAVRAAYGSTCHVERVSAPGYTRSIGVFTQCTCDLGAGQRVSFARRAVCGSAGGQIHRKGVVYIACQRCRRWLLLAENPVAVDCRDIIGSARHRRIDKSRLVHVHARIVVDRGRGYGRKLGRLLEHLLIEACVCRRRYRDCERDRNQDYNREFPLLFHFDFLQFALVAVIRLSKKP